LPQEPQLNPDKDVWGNVEEAVEQTRKSSNVSTEIKPGWARI